jgi:membrane protein involved in colicin uptake
MISMVFWCVCVFYVFVLLLCMLYSSYFGFLWLCFGVRVVFTCFLWDCQVICEVWPEQQQQQQQPQQQRQQQQKQQQQQQQQQQQLQKQQHRRRASFQRF